MYKFVKVELTYGCNLRCHFCGIQSQSRDRPIYYMGRDTLDVIVQRVKEDPKVTVSFSLRGEPTLNPLYYCAVREVAKYAKKTILVSNGANLDQAAIKELFSAGLSALHIDVYNNETAKMVASLTPHNFAIERYEPGGRKVWTDKGLVSICDERKQRDKKTRALHNWAGANRMNEKEGEVIPRQSPCAEPLKMITVRHNGMYALCCHTWNDVAYFKDIRQHSFAEHYNSEDYKGTCRLLMENKRAALHSCKNCNVKSPFAHMFKRAVGL